MLNCQHHIQWVTEVPGGLHQCIQCTRVVTKKDVEPRMEDLPPEFERRWDAWEATRQQEPAVAAAAPKGDAAAAGAAREPPRASARPEPREPRVAATPRAPAPAPPAHPNHPV